MRCTQTIPWQMSAAFTHPVWAQVALKVLVVSPPSIGQSTLDRVWAFRGVGGLSVPRRKTSLTTVVIYKDHVMKDYGFCSILLVITQKSLKKTPTINRRLMPLVTRIVNISQPISWRLLHPVFHRSTHLQPCPQRIWIWWRPWRRDAGGLAWKATWQPFPARNVPQDPRK